MRDCLERINAVMGVKASFVFDTDGRVLAMALSGPDGPAMNAPTAQRVPLGAPASTSVPALVRSAVAPAARPLSAPLAPAALASVALTAAQTMAGLRSVARQRPRDIDLLYADGRVVIKRLNGGCLFVLCNPGVNLPLLNLTAEAAAHRISALLRQQVLAAPAAPALNPSDAKPAAKSPDRLSSFLRPFSR